MLTHTVLFRLHRPAGAEAKAGLVAALEAFAGVAEHTAGPMTVITDLALRDENPHGCDAAISVTFAGREAFMDYLASPPHQALVADVLGPTCESWWSIQSPA